MVDEIGVVSEENDIVDTIRGVGGIEYVYVKNFEKISLGKIFQENFQVEIGKMEYGLEIDGILGFDFIQSSKLVIDSKELQVFVSQ